MIIVKHKLIANTDLCVCAAPMVTLAVIDNSDDDDCCLVHCVGSSSSYFSSGNSSVGNLAS